MKKLIFLLELLFISFVFGQDTPSIIKRKDQYQYVSFSSKVPKYVENTINLYQINYPYETKEKDEFYDKFNIYLSRLLVQGKNTNLIIPYDMYMDINNTLKSQVYPDEKIFYTVASDLSENERNQINILFNIDSSAEYGEEQSLLNCQVYYWLDYLGKSQEYNPATFYTELEKSKLIREAIDKRKSKLEAYYNVKDNIIIEFFIDEAENIKKLFMPLYIADDDLEKVNMSEYRSDLIFTENYLGPIVFGKTILNEKTDNTHLKDYIIKLNVKNIQNNNELLNNLNDSELLISDLRGYSNRSSLKRQNKKASVRIEESSTKSPMKSYDGKDNWDYITR